MSGRKAVKRLLVKSLKDEAEAEEIQRVLESTNGDRKLAATELNISWKTLSYKITIPHFSPGRKLGVGGPVRRSLRGELSDKS